MDIARAQLALHTDRQAFAAELVEDVQRAERLAVIGPAVDEVVELAPEKAGDQT